MKPAPFDYVRPPTVEAAVAALRDANGEGKVLAGGQSLVPLLNFRLATPRVIVDLNRAEGVSVVRASDSVVTVGAMTRTREIERSPEVRSVLPLLAHAASWVGHVQIRNRGTVGGSLAHADPAAELPAIAVLLDATVTVVGPTTTRRIGADELIVGFLTTALAEDEILTEVEFPVPAGRPGWGFHEFALRHGDFALAGAAAVVTVGGDGRTTAARIVTFGGSDRPSRAPAAERALVGVAASDTVIAEAADAAATETLADDPRPDAPYRRQLTRTMVARALADAVQRRPVA